VRPQPERDIRSSAITVRILTCRGLS